MFQSVSFGGGIALSISFLSISIYFRVYLSPLLESPRPFERKSDRERGGRQRARERDGERERERESERERERMSERESDRARARASLGKPLSSLLAPI